MTRLFALPALALLAPLWCVLHIIAWIISIAQFTVQDATT